jgi:hypothetical protein
MRRSAQGLEMMSSWRVTGGSLSSCAIAPPLIARFYTTGITPQATTFFHVSNFRLQQA